MNLHFKPVLMAQGNNLLRPTEASKRGASTVSALRTRVLPTGIPSSPVEIEAYNTFQEPFRAA